MSIKGTRELAFEITDWITGILAWKIIALGGRDQMMSILGIVNKHC